MEKKEENWDSMDFKVVLLYFSSVALNRTKKTLDSGSFDNPGLIEIKKNKSTANFFMILK